MPLFERALRNPVLAPNPADSWEAEAVFNPCVASDGRQTHMLYRAESTRQRVAGAPLELSTIGYAGSHGAGPFEGRRLAIRPEYGWERFGCEDPRITRLDDQYYVFYTALSKYPFQAAGIRVGLAKTKDFHAFEKHPVTTFNAKAMVLFPQRIDGKYMAILTADTDQPPATIGIARFDREEDMWSPAYWDRWYANLEEHRLDLPCGQGDHIEIGAPPVLTARGWVLIYCYIRDYGHDERLFAVEAALLDRDDPTKVIGRAHRPLLCPEAPYELFGRVPNTIFPSGARLVGDRFELYYGGADTSCCVATCDVNQLLEELTTESMAMERYEGNPIVMPDPERDWESEATFNAGVVEAAGRIHLLYRATRPGNHSVIGYASSADGFRVDKRLSEPAYWPRADFEKPAAPDVGFGCEDPRLTRIGDRLHMCYTAYDGVQPPRVALTSIDIDDFVAHRWDAWSDPKLISRPGEMNKDAALFPRQIDGQYAFLHRAGNSIHLDMMPDLEFGNERWLGGRVLMEPPPGAPKIGAAGPPIETGVGWLLLYHAISQRHQRQYEMRAALLDSDDPSRLIADMSYPLLEPLRHYERIGIVPNVVFSCGQAVRDGRLLMYYGGADRVIGVASTDLEKLARRLLAEHAVGPGGRAAPAKA